MDPVEEANYEPCPYDWAHVRAIYRHAREPIEDGVWYEQEHESQTIRYRRKDGYFQFVSVAELSSLFTKLLEMDPMETRDDAEWKVEKHGEGEYLVRSKFTTTCAASDELRRLDELIEPFGLWLENRGAHVSGAVTFSKLTNRDMLDACNRLKLLEDWCLNANKGATEWLSRFWGTVLEWVTEDIKRLGHPQYLADDPSSAKRREPLWRIDRRKVDKGIERRRHLQAIATPIRASPYPTPHVHRPRYAKL